MNNDNNDKRFRIKNLILELNSVCNNNCIYCYIPEENRARPEKPNTVFFKGILEKYFKKGVKNVDFTGGEPTLRKDLVTLVSEADEFVTGLVTNGTLLEELAKPLQRASLDYVQVTLESHDADLFAGGVFTRVGRTVSHFIASYSGPVVIPVGEQDPSMDLRIVSVSANPFSTSAALAHNLACGRPWEVIVISSPLAARRTSSENRFLPSRTVTVFVVMSPPNPPVQPSRALLK